MSTHVLSLLVEDKPGLLTRVAGLFARRGFNIESLAVGRSEIEGLSRITVVVDVEDLPLEQVTKQLNKLINVIKIVELDRDAGEPVDLGVADGERLDVEASAREQARDAGEQAGLVLDEEGEHVGRHGQSSSLKAGE